MKFKFGKSHPDQVVETSSMSVVEPPDLTYNLKIIDEILDSGSLSSLQMEAIAYACQMHEKFLENDERSAFFLGDGPGVGKGRIIAGIIHENKVCGRKKAIWMSVSSDLRFDAIRDLTDVQCYLNVIPLNKLGYNDNIYDFEGYTDDGVLFLTYSTLIGTNNNSNVLYRSRIDQIINWCGKDFDGLMVFDECHKAKNLAPTNGAKPTKTALAVFEIQKKLPNARIIYCSATGATEPRNLAYMYRLGLWGPGTPFNELNGFLRAVEKRGVGGMEIVAMDMKLRGMYIARQLSFNGVKFNIKEIKIEDDFKKIYNKSVKLWEKIFQYSEKALVMCGISGKSNAFFWAKYWSFHQRFFKYLCIASKVKVVIEITKKAINDKKCVIIGLQSTGESHISENDCNLERIISTASGVLTTFVEKSFPIPLELSSEISLETKSNNYNFKIENMMNQTIKRPINLLNTFNNDDFIDVDEDTINTKISKKSKIDHDNGISDALEAAGLTTFKYSWGNSTNMTKIVAKENIHLSNEQICLRWKQELLDEIEKLSPLLPANTLDKLIDEFGGINEVAEMTGRKGRIVKINNDVYAYRSRGSDELPLEYVNISERSKFMNGEKLIAIISEAASAGISLQADRRCSNRRKRVHITLELPWSADKAVQQFGRSHRSNQLYPPEYIFVISELAGEKRFASSVAKRLESLGALTHGDRRSSETRDLSQFNFENKHGRLALNYMLNYISNNTIPNYFKLPNNYTEKKFINESMEAFKNCGLSNFLKTSNIGNIIDDNSNLFEQKTIKATTKISRFLNRLLGINVDLQNTIFNFYLSVLNKIVKDEKKAGKWDSGILDWGITGEKVNIDNISQYTIHSKNSESKVELIKLSIERGISYDELITIYPIHLFEKGEGFYTISKFKNFQSIILVKKVQNTNSGGMYEGSADSDSDFYNFSTLYKIIRPNLGESAKNETLETIKSRYSLIDNDTGKYLWNNQYHLSLEQCTHFYRWGKCSTFARSKQCDHGKRKKTAFILCGAIFGIWDIIENSFGDLQIRISRVTTSEGNRKVGIIVQPSIVENIKTKLISATTDSFKRSMFTKSPNNLF